MNNGKFFEELAARNGQVFDAHPELVDHGADYPWLLGALGDPFSPVWFVAENPSLTQVQKRSSVSSPEVQWSVSPGDRILRDALALHGFKSGDPLEPGGWHCYLTDVVKSADIVTEWRQQPEADRLIVAETWAPVLAWELEQGKPDFVVVLGGAAMNLLKHLETRQLIPSLPDTRQIYHYSYLGSRPESSGLRRGPGHPDRITEWHRQFAEIAARFPPPATPR